MPASARTAAARSGPSPSRDSRVEWTRRTWRADRAQGDQLVDGRGAQPETAEQVVRRRLDHVDHGGADPGLLEVERQVEVGTALVEQLAQRRDVLGQVVGHGTRDRPAPTPDTDDTVVIEHGHAVGGQPDVALEPGGPELQGDPERLDRVLRRPVAGASMGEADRRIEQRRQPLLHER